MAKLSLIVDSSQAEAALRNFIKTTEGVTVATDKTVGAFGRMVKSLAALGLAYKAYDFARDALRQADQADRAAGKFSRVFGGMAGEMRQWSSSVSAALKVQESDVQRAASKFQIMFENMNIGTRTAREMTRGITELGAKLAIVNRTSVEEALGGLESGMMGNNRALRELGITINDTLIEQYALEKGWISQGQTLNQTGRAYTVLQMIMEQTAKATAGVGDASKHYSEQQRQLNTNLSETKEIIGSALKPAVTDALTSINNGLRQSQSFIKRWASDFVEGFAAVRDAAHWVGDLFKPAERMPDSYRQGAIAWYRQVTGDTKAFERTIQETGLEGETAPKYMAKWHQLLTLQTKMWEQDRDKALRQAKQAVEGLGEAPGALPPVPAEPPPPTTTTTTRTGSGTPGELAFYDTTAAQGVLDDLQLQHKLLYQNNVERQITIALDQAQIKKGNELAAAIEKEIRALEKAQRLRALADDIGQAFGSAFERVVFEAGKAREALQALLEDISRAIMRRMITEPLVDYVSTGLMQWWGSGSLPRGADANPAMAYVAHGGGVVGYDWTPQRAVAPWVFLGARRYHHGLFPGEEPAILQKGETVLPAGSKPNVTVNITNNSSAPVAANVSDIKFDLRRMVVGIMLEDQQINGPVTRGYAANRRG